MTTFTRVLAVASPYLLSMFIILYVLATTTISSSEIVILVVAFLLSVPSGYYDIIQYLEKQKSDLSLDHTIREFKNNLNTIAGLHSEVVELKNELADPWYEHNHSIQQDLKKSNRRIGIQIEEAKMRIKQLVNHISTYAPTHPSFLSSKVPTSDESRKSDQDEDAQKEVE